MSKNPEIVAQSQYSVAAVDAFVKPPPPENEKGGGGKRQGKTKQARLPSPGDRWRSSEEADHRGRRYGPRGGPIWVKGKQHSKKTVKKKKKHVIKEIVFGLVPDLASRFFKRNLKVVSTIGPAVPHRDDE